MHGLPSFLNIVIVEKCKPTALQLPALVQVTSQKWPKQRNEVSIVVIKALSQPASFRVKPRGLDEQRILLRLKLGIEHHPVHDIVQHQLQTLPDNQAFSLHTLLVPQVIDH